MTQARVVYVGLGGTVVRYSVTPVAVEDTKRLGKRLFRFAGYWLGFARYEEVCG
jgi:hypothetical protein